jgi:hypothetical protein
VQNRGKRTKTRDRYRGVAQRKPKERHPEPEYSDGATDSGGSDTTIEIPFRGPVVKIKRDRKVADGATAKKESKAPAGSRARARAKAVVETTTERKMEGRVGAETALKKNVGGGASNTRSRNPRLQDPMKSIESSARQSPRTSRPTAVGLKLKSAKRERRSANPSPSPAPLRKRRG